MRQRAFVAAGKANQPGSIFGEIEKGSSRLRLRKYVFVLSHCGIRLMPTLWYMRRILWRAQFRASNQAAKILISFAGST